MLLPSWSVGSLIRWEAAGESVSDIYLTDQWAPAQFLCKAKAVFCSFCVADSASASWGKSPTIVDGIGTVKPPGGHQADVHRWPSADTGGDIMPHSGMMAARQKQNGPALGGRLYGLGTSCGWWDGFRCTCTPASVPCIHLHPGDTVPVVLYRWTGIAILGNRQLILLLCGCFICLPLSALKDIGKLGCSHSSFSLCSQSYPLSCTYPSTCLCTHPCAFLTCAPVKLLIPM